MALSAVPFALDGLSASIVAVAGDDDLRFAIDDPVPQRLGAEPSENHAVDRTDPGTGKHRDGKFRYHGEVDRDPVTLLYTVFLQYIRKLTHMVVELLVGIGLGLLQGLPLPDEGGLIPLGGQMPVEAVIADIQFPPGKPFQFRLAEIPFRNLVPLLIPVEKVGLLAPELVGIVDRLLVEFLILLHSLDIGLLLDLLGRLKNPFFIHHRHEFLLHK